MRALMLVGVLVIAVPDRPDRTPMELKRQHPIHGDWQDHQHSPSVLRLLPGESLFMIGGKVSTEDGFTGICLIDWCRDPVSIDIMSRRGGPKLTGILKLEGDSLTLAFPTNNMRPTNFGGLGSIIYQYNRVRK